MAILYRIICHLNLESLNIKTRRINQCLIPFFFLLSNRFFCFNMLFSTSSIDLNHVKMSCAIALNEKKIESIENSLFRIRSFRGEKNIYILSNRSREWKTEKFANIIECETFENSLCKHQLHRWKIVLTSKLYQKYKILNRINTFNDQRYLFSSWKITSKFHIIIVSSVILFLID